ncbi:MAG: hypothetical protein PHF97_09160 [Bacteroidales bacterium]|nr:hypothetical protein [Bacteroidales bacterium]
MSPGDLPGFGNLEGLGWLGNPEGLGWIGNLEGLGWFWKPGRSLGCNYFEYYIL